LAQLPRLSAAKRLLEFIAATPGALPAYLSAKTVSDRLIDLLPSPADVMIRPPASRDAPALTRSPIWPVVIAVILAILLIVINLRPAVQADEPHLTSSSIVLLKEAGGSR